MKKVRFKKSRFYQELRYIFRSLTLYRSPFSYLYHRFVIGPKIQRLAQPIDRKPESDLYSIHMLCNHEGLNMLLWSLASWYAVTDKSGQVYIHEDGTFTKLDRDIIKKFLPNAIVVDRAWATSQVQDWLAQYPAALSFRKNEGHYIYALKFIDPYFVSKTPARLVIDIDVLWFENPQEVLDRLLNKKNPFMMRGHVAMDYRFADGTALGGELQMANAGIIGYQKDNYSLERLEEFFQRNGKDNPSRLIDQACYVYILSHASGFSYLDEQLYSLKPKSGLVARHYTGPVREKFWFEGVKNLKSKFKILK